MAVQINRPVKSIRSIRMIRDKDTRLKICGHFLEQHYRLVRDPFTSVGSQ
jgi:hypothetical protein